MPIPKRKPDEDRTDFLSRCMSNETMNKEYPDNAQRYAVCVNSSKESKGDQVKDAYYEDTYGSTEIIYDEKNVYIPSEDEYIDLDDDVEDYAFAAKPGLWENIRKKKEREGKKYKPAKPGDPDRPNKDAWKKAQSDDDDSGMQISQIQKMHDQLMMLSKIVSSIPVEFQEWTKDHISKAEYYIQSIYDAVLYPSKEEEEEDDIEDMEEVTPTDEDMLSLSVYEYEDPKTGEVYRFKRKGIYRKNGVVLTYLGTASEYQGRKVKLNKPFRTPDGPKKFSVYVKNDKGNVVKVNFGDPNMEIKRDNPARRKSFRARHHCDTNPGPKWKARYWSCKMW